MQKEYRCRLKNISNANVLSGANTTSWSVFPSKAQRKTNHNLSLENSCVTSTEARSVRGFGSYSIRKRRQCKGSYVTTGQQHFNHTLVRYLRGRDDQTHIASIVNTFFHLCFSFSFILSNQYQNVIVDNGQNVYNQA